VLILTLTLVGFLVLAVGGHRAGIGEYVEASDHVERRLQSRGMVWVVFAVSFAVLWYSWAAWNPIPVVHDEMAYVLQAQIYARGHWSLPSPPMPLFWEQPHVLTEPRLAAKYFPGHPLLMAIGAALHWMALMPLVLHATSAALLFVLVRRVANGAVAFATWIIWLFSLMVLYFGPSYFSEATTTVCWLAGWYALLEWRRTRHARWLVLVALFTAWCAIARPLTGVAYALPIAVVVLRDATRERLWRDLLLALVVGVAVVGIVPLWSAHTTGDWRVTPLALYTRMYMPYDLPGFGLITTPPTHSVTPELQQINNVYSSSHVNHFLSTLPSTLATRARYLFVSIWGSTLGVLAVFAVLGLVTLGAEGAFAVGTGVLLLLTYLAFATPATWTLYYFESVPGYAFLTASGMAWAASLIGRPRGAAPTRDMTWRSPRWSRTIVAAACAFTLPGLVSLQSVHQQHIGDRRHLAPFYALLSNVHDPKAVVFVRYKAFHDPHVTFVRNTADLEHERIWIVYDRGDAENAQLLGLAKDRRGYLFDEEQRHFSPYDPTIRP
jgi:hypothetical protein